MTKSQRRGTALLTGLVAAALVVAPLQVTLAAAEDAPDGLETMGQYDASNYVDEAAALPVELVDAITRDLGLSAEQYLAESDAAVQAGDVVTSLEDSGVDVLGSEIDGTDLTVFVDTDAAAAVVEAVGATAELGAPEVEPLPQLPLSFATDLYGGQGYYWEKTTDNSGYQCSIGFNGYLVSNGASQLATAGHCTGDMNNLDGSVRALNMTAPGQPSSTGQVGGSIGLPVAGTSQFGGGFDIGRIAVTSGNMVAKPSVLTWGNGSGAPLSSVPLAITRSANPTVGANLCRSGSRTGWRCGAIQEVTTALIGPDEVPVHSIIATVCVLPGDSGGSAMIGSAAVGITSWRAGSETGNTPASCATTPYSGFFPMQGPDETVASAYGANWELAVTVSTPAVSFTGTGNLTTTLSGTLANASAPSRVKVYIDGSPTPIVATVSGGSWSVPISVANGLHSYRVQAEYGKWSKSASASGWFRKGVTVDRISGADRFATAAAVAAHFGTADTVYVAFGRNYPDALSAAPAAAFVDGPLLLTESASLPDSTADAIVDLNPSKIIVVGGTSAISPTVVQQLRSLMPSASVTRQAGPGRYETSRLITAEAFPENTTTTAYIATGANFPDALAASAAAGSRSAPVILVNGSATTVDQATKDLLADLGVTQVYIAGGTAVVSQAIENILEGLPGVTADRVAGADRVTTGVAINLDAFTTVSEAYLAVGWNYADALAGAALAGSDGAPLFVVPADCVPAEVLSAFASLDVTTVHLLGGPAALSTNVAALKNC